MRWFTGALATAGMFAMAGAATAAPSVDISHTIARVIVSPEPRTDIKVEIVKANPRLPIRVWSFFGRTYVDGGLAAVRVHECRGPVNAPSAFVAGVGEVSGDAVPKILIHTPMDARIAAAGAAFGQVGRSDSLVLTNAGCGDWQVGNVRGKMKINVAGSGSVRTGQAGAAELMAAGSGDVRVLRVTGPVHKAIVGSGDVRIGS